MLSKRILVLMFVMAFLTLLVGCFPSAPPITENQAPVITSTPATTAEVGIPYNYNVNATDPDVGDTLIYTLTTNPSWMTINSATGLIIWTPISSQVGDNAVEVEVSDGALSDTQSFTIVVKKPYIPTPPVNHAPIITSIPITDAVMGVAYLYDVEATDPDGDTLTYSLAVKPFGMGINSANGVIDWIPTAEGAFAVEVKVSDGKKSDTQNFTITVKTVEIFGIEVLPETMTLVTGTSETIQSVTALYNIKADFEVPIPLGDCTYVSDDSGVAKVSPNFEVDAGFAGEAIITVSYAGMEDTIEVTVVLPVHNIDTDEYFGTIQGAIVDAETLDSHTIEVAAGTYNERITIGKALTIKSTDGAAQTTITEAGLSTPNPDVLIQIPANVNDVTIDGFTLNGDQFNTVADTSVIRVGGSAGGGPNSNVVITNNVINGMFGIIWRGGDTLTVSNNTFVVNKNGVAINSATTNVVISDNTIGPGTSMIGDPSGIYATDCDNCQITGNTITNMVGTDDKGEGIMVPRGSDIVISGNIITGNSVWGIGWWSSATSYTITNNTISDNGHTAPEGETRNDGINIGAGTDININNNNIFGNAGEGINSLVVVDATNNWWGSEFGPKHNGFPANGGDAVSDNVDYSNWSTTPN